MIADPGPSLRQDEKQEQDRFIFLTFKVLADGIHSREIDSLLFEEKVMTLIRWYVKNQVYYRHSVHLVMSCGFQ